MSAYRNRIADKLLQRKLEGKGAVLLEGAKWCGKTTTAEQIAKSILYMSDPSRLEHNIQLSKINPALLLEGEKPRLIDEWQIAPKLWDAIRFDVDHSKLLGSYVLTGSSVPPDMKDITHTGTGRIARLRMRTMSLWESGESTGEISLAHLFTNPKQIAAISKDSNLRRMAFISCRGGWPMSIDMREDIALEQAFDYIEAIENRDISLVDGINRDAISTHRLLRSYARLQGQQAPYSTIKKDLEANEANTLSEDTIASYINALKKIFVIEDVEAWSPNLRSKYAIRSSDTRYFTDPSIATASLGLSPDDLINDLNTFGFIFETLCIRDLRIYAEALNGNIYHFRDKSGLECDAVIHLRNSSYGLIEIKLGGSANIEKGAETLKKLESQIDTDKMKAPSFLMVLTAVGDYAYRREDGVYVVPISTLKD